MDRLTVLRWRLPSSRRRGFNLVEAAIVLGVIGLVIGGIWVAAASITQRMKANDAKQALGQIIEIYKTNYDSIKHVSSINFGSLLNTQTFGGGFTYDSVKWSEPVLYGNGLIFSQIFHYQGWGMGLEINFMTYPDGVEAPQTYLCTEISKFLLLQNFSQTPGSELSWEDGSLSWIVGTTKPSVTQIIDACETTTTLSVYFLMP